ncbi:MAG: protease modulator HflC [Verrucomicrobia bacterium]|nr:protease modulator HflC [Verrucomicrobiota bacterium]
MKFTRVIIGLVALLILLSSSAFTVSEIEQVFITQFGKPGRAINANPAKNEAGLHFKVPFIQRVNRIEKRILEWNGPAEEMPTRDKLYISVDSFARWRIANPVTYYEKLRDEPSALSRLNDNIGSATRSVIAAHNLIEVVRSQIDRKAVRDETLVETESNVGVLPAIQYGRSVLEAQILKAAQKNVDLWGIELLDVRFKRINYKSGVIDKIYARMISERQQIAERFRSEGAGEAVKIIGKKDRELLSIQSEAYRQEQEIKGQADGQATGIYAQAYNSSPSAADFYQFVKTLETYQKTLAKDTTLIFTSDSDLFRLFKRIDPLRPPVPTR